MYHNFYPGRAGDWVDATLVGVMDFDGATREIQSFQLATEKATYGKAKFDAVVRSVESGR
jgi:hypothetical protein